jgi:uncharacterized protein (TIRG00374 family)
MRWRKIVLIGLVGVFSVVFIIQIGDITELVETVQKGQPFWITVALALQLLWFLNQACLYQSIYSLLGLPARIRRLAPIVLASNFVNFVTPSASLGALPLFLDDAHQRGLNAGRVALTNILRLLLNLIWFSILLAFSLTMLFLWHQLQSYHIIAAAILFVVAVLMVGGLVLAGLRPNRLVRLLVWVASVLNQLRQYVLTHDLLKADRAEQFATQFSQAAVVLWEGRWRLVRPWLHIMLFDALEMAMLYAVFRAFPGGDQRISFAMLVTGYSVGVLFSVVAITPQGVGAVEGLLVAVFRSFGLPAGRVAVIVLVYRGLSFWLPLLVGFAAVRWVHGLGKPIAEKETKTDH